MSQEEPSVCQPMKERGRDKTVATAQEAVADIMAGSTIAVGGFGLCGIPSVLLEALLRSDADDLEVFSNNAGVEDGGLGPLLAPRWPMVVCRGSTEPMGLSKSPRRSRTCGLSPPRAGTSSSCCELSVRVKHVEQRDDWGQRFSPQRIVTLANKGIDAP